MSNIDFQKHPVRQEEYYLYNLNTVDEESNEMKSGLNIEPEGFKVPLKGFY